MLTPRMDGSLVASQALISPTDKNISDAMQGGVDAAELASVLPPHMLPATSRCCFLPSLSSRASPYPGIVLIKAFTKFPCFPLYPSIH